MQLVIPALQVVAALVLLSVWLVRFGRETPYRGGNAQSMKEEFAAYGLPAWSMYVVGTLKVGLAVALIAGLWLPTVVVPAALLLGGLMLGAVAAHLKIRDPLRKSMPALVMLLLSICIALGAWR